MISKKTYEKEIQDVKKTYIFENNDFYKSEYYALFMIVSVGLARFLPNVNKSQHKKLTLDMLLHRDLSYVDQFFPEKMLKNLQVYDKQNAISNCVNEAQIFVTYHTGSYRLFIHQMIAENVPFCLVTQKEYIDNYGEVSQEIVKETKNDHSSKLDIISAEDPRLLFQLKAKIERGISVVFYIDGNTGVSEKDNEDNKNLSNIKFLNHQIYARQGIAFLAYLTKAPIVTAVCTRLSDSFNELNVNYLDASKLNQISTRKKYITEVTKMLYEQLAEFVQKHPEQWEGWFYLDKFYNKNSFSNTNDLDRIKSLGDQKSISIGMDDLIELYSYDQNFFLALKSDLKVLNIGEFKYQTIKYFEKARKLVPGQSNEINGLDFPWKKIEELIMLNILKIV